MRKYYAVIIRLFFLTVLLLPADYSKAGADEFLGYPAEVYIVNGEVETLRVNAITRIALADPEVVDIMEAEVDEILLIGKRPGRTALFVWDADGKHTVMLYVSNEDLTLVQDQVKALLKKANINEVAVEIDQEEGKIILSGKYPKSKLEKFEKILDLRSLNDIIVDLTEEFVSTRMIQLDVQVTELNSTFTEALGIDWITGGSGEGTTASLTGTDFTPTYTETLPTFDGSIKDFFKIGDFSRTSIFQANLQALLEKGEAQILSKPKLIVQSGQEASFLVGGEIPIRTTTSTDGATQENVEFKEYGLGMTVTPTILEEKIEIILNMEISDIDTSNRVGDDVAFLTRTAQTQLFLDDKQTVIIAGLIKKNKALLLKEVPFLGKVPVLGALFRSKSTPGPNTDQELVISFTPTLLKSPRKAQVKSNTSIWPSSTGTFQDTSPAYGYRGLPQEMNSYVRNIQRKISNLIQYPQEAEHNGWEGTVKLGLHILRDGTLAFALIQESSGHALFDDDALKAAKSTAPYDSFPAGVDVHELDVTIPIIYNYTWN